MEKQPQSHPEHSKVVATNRAEFTAQLVEMYSKEPLRLAHLLDIEANLNTLNSTRPSRIVTSNK